MASTDHSKRLDPASGHDPEQLAGSDQCPPPRSPPSVFQGTDGPTVFLARLWRFLSYSDGRDKGLKVIQYTTKLYLLKHAHHRHKNLESLVRNFSLARRIMRLLHWVQPLEELSELLASYRRRPEPMARIALVLANAVLCVLNDVVDDVVCLIKVGVLDQHKLSHGSRKPSCLRKFNPVPLAMRPPPAETNLHRWESISTFLWFSTLVLDIYEVHRSAAWKEGGKKRWSAVKTCADGIFCSYDFWEVYGWRRKYEKAGPILSALASAVIGCWKVWLKC